MAYQIRVSPNALREASARQREIGAQVSDIGQDVAALTRWLDGAWDGNASQQAVASLQYLRVALNQIGEYIQNGASQLGEIANCFETADNGVVRRFPRLLASAISVKGGMGFNFGVSKEVRIDPDEVRMVASRIDREGDALRQICNRLENHLHGLAADWEGRASRSFCENMDLIIDDMQRLSEEVETFARRLYSVASRYEEMDKNLF